MKNLLALLATVFTLLATTSQSFSQPADHPGIWTTLTRANSDMPGDSVRAITFDTKDSLWIAAWQGVAQQIPGGWSRYNQQVYMPSNEIWDLDRTNGSLWIAHHNGITRFDGTSWITHTVDNSELVNAPVLHFAHDNRGDLWYATARGLGRLSSTNTWSSYKHETVPAMPYNGIEALATDASNNLWMSFIGTAGLVLLPEGNSALAKYLKQDSIPGFPKGAVYIKCLAVDWSGDLWAGTARHGVVRINSAGATIYTRQTTPIIANDTINAVMVDQCGNVWIGTEGGAVMYDGANWSSYTKSGGNLPNDHVYTIKPDRFGHVWIGTKGGIAEFKPLPTVPVLQLPAMAAVIDSNAVLCQWYWSCPNILNYWYERADNPQFINSTIDTTSPSLMGSRTVLDTGLLYNTTYYWRVKALNDAGWSAFSEVRSFTLQSSSVQRTESAGYKLYPSYPNPTTGLATIAFEAPRYGVVSITLTDALGRTFATGVDGAFGPGKVRIPIDLSDLPTGVYICTLQAAGVSLERTLQIVR